MRSTELKLKLTLFLFFFGFLVVVDVVEGEAVAVVVTVETVEADGTNRKSGLTVTVFELSRNEAIVEEGTEVVLLAVGLLVVDTVEGVEPVEIIVKGGGVGGVVVGGAGVEVTVTLKVTTLTDSLFSMLAVVVESPGGATVTGEGGSQKSSTTGISVVSLLLVALPLNSRLVELLLLLLLLLPPFERTSTK